MHMPFGICMTAACGMWRHTNTSAPESVVSVVQHCSLVTAPLPAQRMAQQSVSRGRKPQQAALCTVPPTSSEPPQTFKAFGFGGVGPNAGATGWQVIKRVCRHAVRKTVHKLVSLAETKK